MDNKTKNTKNKPKIGINSPTIDTKTKNILISNQKYKFFQNKECPFFPCHKNVPIEEFNCLFCYCPLYALNKDCGGNYRILEDGTKDCSQCIFPHKKDNFDKLVNKLSELINEVKDKNNKG